MITARYLVVTILAIILFFGFLSVYDLIVGDKVPKLIKLSHIHPATTMAGYNTTKNKNVEGKHDLWLELQPTLKILDHVCPEAANWFRVKYATGKVVLNKESKNYASYNCVTDKVKINKLLLNEVDGVKASIIAHEFRHSRQNWSKYVKSFLSQLIFNKYEPRILETDAYLFEKEIKEILFTL